MGGSMKIGGWTRLVILVSAAWIIAVCGVALYELLHWAPTELNPSGKQFFFYYYSDTSASSGFHPLLKGFKTREFIEVLGWPLAALWATYFLLAKGTRWVRQGFKDTSI